MLPGRVSSRPRVLCSLPGKIPGKKSKHAKNYLKYRTALGRFGKVEELTGIIVFLSSDYSSFFHGSILQPDGGQSRQHMAFTYL